MLSNTRSTLNSKTHPDLLQHTTSIPNTPIENSDPNFLGFGTKSHTKPNCPLVLVKILNLGICGEFRISPCSYPFFTFSSPKIVNHNSLDINSPLLVIVGGGFFFSKKYKEMFE
ncbi:hypothetical protein AABB24_011925 [Solanum stoloniferum]|uniref:Uncharacterized protein n=1 Tax=Solanum stoloniferum TaxID=62892 RepID=A0ABD2UFY4_9SOLN